MNNLECRNFSIRVSLVLLCLVNSELKFFIVRSKDRNWHLPYSFLKLNETFEQAAKNSLGNIISKQELKFIQLKNLKLNKINYLKKTIFINYLSIKNNEKLRLRYNLNTYDFNWFNKEQIENLMYHDKKIIKNSIEEIMNIANSNPKIIFNFLPKEFTLTELQHSFLSIGLKNKNFEEKRNFRKWIAQYNNKKGFVISTNKFKYGTHRPAKLYKPGNK